MMNVDDWNGMMDEMRLKHPSFIAKMLQISVKTTWKSNNRENMMTLGKRGAGSPLLFSCFS